MNRETVLEKLREICKVQAEQRPRKKPVNLDSEGDLAAMGFDSLDLSEIIVEVEEAFNCVIRMDELSKLKTMGDLVDIVVAKIA